LGGRRQKYVSNPNVGAIAGIVRHCGIALQKRDSSPASFTDKEAVERVRKRSLRVCINVLLNYRDFL